MQVTRHLILLFGLSNLLHGQTTVTLDGATGSQSYTFARSTNGGLTIGLGFEVEYLVVAGGGGGGGANGSYDGGGGGGAGGMLTGATFLNAGNISVTVGQGGEKGYNNSSITSRRGKNGGDSSFGNLVAVGGGGGGTTSGSGDSINYTGANGLSGGSGGGAGANEWSSGSSALGGASTTGQGNYGGNSVDSGYGWVYGAGGGGGAGGLGGNGSENSALFNEWARGGDGGVGLASSISGAAVMYAGGGGGGAERGNFGSETAGSGGSGGGGNGSTGSGNNGGNGTNNRGGGGGGAGNDANGGTGGSGIVIVRYKGTAAGTGGTVTSGTGTAAGYTLHTFSATGTTNLEISGESLNSKLGAVENGVISGSGDLTFTGPGRLTLNAANTYSGLTRVNAGTLALGSTGSIGSSSGVSIANGAYFNVSTVAGGFTLGSNQTLSGGGTITGDVVISDTHSPGFSPAIQTFENNLTYAAGSTIQWELLDGRVDGRGSIYDGIDVAGNLSFAPGVTLALDFATLGSDVDWRDAFWASSITGTAGWKVFDVQGTISGFENLQIAGSDWADSLSNNLSFYRPGSSFTLFKEGSGIYLNYNAVPEPGMALLGGLGVLVLLRRRRF